MPVLAGIRKPLIFLMFYPALASAGLIGPSNYWECILVGMQDVKNDQVAQEIMKVCLSDFPDSSSMPAPLDGTPGACILKFGEDVSSAFAALQIQTACNVVYAP
jgi:hypothetical protein